MARLPWHGPLFPVKNHLAERYAQALRQARGLECALSAFSVDRMGWSPQLAATLGDDYLGDGALRYAIILSPDQAEAPPLRRRFSYEAALIEQVYLDARATILSLIDREAAVVTLDNGLTFCRNACDVLNITAVDAALDTPSGTLHKSRTLLELAHGLGEKSRLLDEGYIDQMLALAKQVGDPRKRVQAADLRQPVGSLWAEVNGPVYVLRADKGAPLVVTLRIDDDLRATNAVALAIDDADLVDHLHTEGFLSYANVATLLPKRVGELELDALLSADQTPAEEGSARRHQLGQVAAVRAALPPLYWELDGVQKRLASGGKLNIARLSVAARWALAMPVRDADVVGHLLARFVRFDLRMLVLHHRWAVQKEWDGYSAAKRRYLAALFPYMLAGFSNGVMSAANVQATPN